MLETLAVVAFLATIGNRLVEAVVTPLFDKYKWDKFLIMYVTWVITTGLVLLSGTNLFEGYLGSVLAGKILTGILAGGGANFLHDIFDQKP